MFVMQFFVYFDDNDIFDMISRFFFVGSYVLKKLLKLNNINQIVYCVVNWKINVDF